MPTDIMKESSETFVLGMHANTLHDSGTTLSSALSSLGLQSGILSAGETSKKATVTI